MSESKSSMATMLSSLTSQLTDLRSDTRTFLSQGLEIYMKQVSTLLDDSHVEFKQSLQNPQTYSEISGRTTTFTSPMDLKGPRLMDSVIQSPTIDTGRRLDEEAGNSAQSGITEVDKQPAYDHATLNLPDTICQQEVSRIEKTYQYTGSSGSLQSRILQSKYCLFQQTTTVQQEKLSVSEIKIFRQIESLLNFIYKPALRIIKRAYLVPRKTEQKENSLTNQQQKVEPQGDSDYYLPLFEGPLAVSQFAKGVRDIIKNKGKSYFSHKLALVIKERVIYLRRKLYQRLGLTMLKNIAGQEERRGRQTRSSTTKLKKIFHLLQECTLDCCPLIASIVTRTRGHQILASQHRGRYNLRDVLDNILDYQGTEIEVLDSNQLVRFLQVLHSTLKKIHEQTLLIEQAWKIYSKSVSKVEGEIRDQDPLEVGIQGQCQMIYSPAKHSELVYNLILRENVFKKLMRLKRNTPDSALFQTHKNLKLIQQALADQIKVDTRAEEIWNSLSRRNQEERSRSIESQSSKSRRKDSSIESVQIYEQKGDQLQIDFNQLEPEEVVQYIEENHSKAQNLQNNSQGENQKKEKGSKTNKRHKRTAKKKKLKREQKSKELQEIKEHKEEVSTDIVIPTLLKSDKTQLTSPPDKSSIKEKVIIKEEEERDEEEEQEIVETSLDQKIQALKKKWKVKKNESRKVTMPYLSQNWLQSLRISISI